VTHAADEKPLVLVADNEEDIIALVAFKLEREGYEVIGACDGEQALELLHERHPRLALLDVHMPKLDGYDLTRAIRNDECLRTMPVIILSASVNQEDIEASFEAGADDHLKKPFSPASLAARVEAFLEAR
jgi:CheY-like chemotaxis protein